MAAVLSPAPVWRRRPPFRFRRAFQISDAAFVVAWEVQSQIATLVLVGLIAFASIWLALVAILAWSLVASLVYFVARQRGLPDLVVIDVPHRAHGPSKFLRHAAGSAVRAWFVGIHNIVFAKAACLALRPGEGLHCELRRIGVLGVGITLFGVTTAYHLLHRAGFRGKALLYRGMLAPLLNVPYRVFLSAAVIHALWSAADAICGVGACLG